MSDNYHTPISEGAAANASTFNDPMGELDEALTEALLEERDGHIIQEEGVDLAQQARLDFVGAGVTVTNEVGKTKVTIPGGVTDHGALSGLADDDHPQYLKKIIQTGYRNLVLDGGMQCAQEFTSISGLSTTRYVLDVWGVAMSSLGVWAISQDNSVPSGSGHTKSIKVLCTTADASPANSDFLVYRQLIEGQNLQRLRKGTASAKQVTFSFWVISKIPGTYIIEMLDNDNSRHASNSYTINAADTWEFKTVTFPADTSGVLDNDENTSLILNFWLAAGDDYKSGALATAWESTVTANRAVGQVNLASAINNYWQMTGVQVEEGAEASDFEFVPFDQMLLRCMRYVEKSYDYATPAGTATTTGCHITTARSGYYAYEQNIQYRIPKRGTPSMSLYSTSTGTPAKWRDATAGADRACALVINGLNGFIPYCNDASMVAGNEMQLQWFSDARL